MTVLVTGASGLVGARLLPRLVAVGVPCRALLRAGNPAPSGATAVVGDLLDPATLASAVRGVSAIIHLAAVFRTQDEALMWRSNLDGTCNLIAVAKAHAPAARLILASTCQVYGKDGEHPGREDDAVATLAGLPGQQGGGRAGVARQRPQLMRATPPLRLW